MADHLLPQHSVFSDAALKEVYARLVEMLDTRKIPATFAFVSGLIAGRDAALDFLESVHPVHGTYAAWIAQLRQAIATFPGGWFLPDLPAQILGSGIHEFASHGGTHAPLAENACADDDFKAEMRFVRATEATLGLHSETFIFPRNQGGHHRSLAVFGFRGYRRAHPLELRRTAVFALLRMAAEWLPQTGARHAASAPLVAIPPGTILNFAHGFRRYVPRRVTVRRATAAMIRSAGYNRALHYYSHPHNFVSDRALFDTFRQVLDQAAELRERGRIAILTQAAYIDSLAA